MSLLTLTNLDIPIPIGDYLEDLQAYNTNEGADRLLDVERFIVETQSFYPLLVPFPTGSDTAIGAGKQFHGSIRIPIGSILTMLTGDQIGVGTAGFKIKVYDRGTSSDLIDRQFIKDSLFTSSLGNGDNVTNPVGANMISDPGIVILSPGSLQVSITNLDPVNAATIQVLFAFAVPLSTIAGTVNRTISTV